MEFVYVIERAKLFDLAVPHGFVAAAREPELTERWIARIREHGFFVERRKAEQDSSLKQVIPYALIQRDDHFLQLERTPKQGEARLHGKRSVGIGGHINPVDTDEDADPLASGLHREVQEELRVDSPLEFTVAGFVNDDTTDVGSVHFGLVILAKAASQSTVDIGETDKMVGELVTREELETRYRQDPGRFETWSAFVIEQLDDVLSATLTISAGWSREAGA